MPLFGSSKKIFKSKQEIKDALYRVKTLDYRERPNVYEALVKELGDGGVTSHELRRVIGELKAKGEISEIDKKNLLGLIN